MVEPVGRADIDAAAARIAGYVRRTPVVMIEGEAFGLDGPISLKLDSLQPTGSFKPRGAFSLLTAEHPTSAGVVGASGGNFGLALAYAARTLGHRATIFVPATSPANKIDGLHALGADVEVVDGYYPEALAASEAWAEARGALFAHAYDQRPVVEGQGTCAAELDQQMPGLDTVVVAVGGGGLVGGMAGWFGERVRVVAVETDRTPTLHAAREAGRPIDVEVGGVAASSLGAGRIGEHCWAANHWIDQSILVSDDEAVDAQHRLWDTCRLASEPGCAAALAALTSGHYRREPGEKIAVVICGANVEPSTLIGRP